VLFARRHASSPLGLKPRGVFTKLIERNTNDCPHPEEPDSFSTASEQSQPAVTIHVLQESGRCAANNKTARTV